MFPTEISSSGTSTAESNYGNAIYRGEEICLPGRGDGGVDASWGFELHSWSSLSGAWCYSLAASLHTVSSYFADPNRFGKIPLYVKNLV